MTTLLRRNLISRSPWRPGFFLITLALDLAWFALSPMAQAADGDLGHGNTAEGASALPSVTTGIDNTALGTGVMGFNRSGSYNTGTGWSALNETGDFNTADGYAALHRDGGDFNTATGALALAINGAGSYNTANGAGALQSNTTGKFNTANGFQALYRNTTADNNTAVGVDALYHNTSGNSTAVGFEALSSNTTGGGNTATGFRALYTNNGDYNTATGNVALQSNTTGSDNTATGSAALLNNKTGFYNTANGVTALYSNIAGNDNTATGFRALVQNNGSDNTANGFQALQSNTNGTSNTATGVNALSNNNGVENTATGKQALFHNTSGNFNTATGVNALENTTGSFNTANGVDALQSNISGTYNTADGEAALSSNTTGSNNIALGFEAGLVTIGNYNIDIGNFGSSESNTIRIGDSHQTFTFIAGIYNVNEGGTPLAVYINSNGQLGTQPGPSSRRFKKEIKPMDQTSQAVLGLKPVTFQYKSDTKGTAQFGLIAEEVAQVDPDLVVRDAQGEPYTVRYEAVNAMLLNEFLKEHRTVQELKSTVAKQEAIIAQQQKGMEAFAARLEKQDSKIQKVSAQLELNKPVPQMVAKNQ